MRYHEIIVKKASLILIVLLVALPVITCSNTLPSTEQTDEGDGTDDSATGGVDDGSTNDGSDFGDGSPASTADLKLATWNIRILSNNSRDDTELELIAPIIARYDLVARLRQHIGSRDSHLRAVSQGPPSIAQRGSP